MLLACMMILSLHGTPADCANYAVPVSSVQYTVRHHDTLRDLSLEFLGTRNRTELAHTNNMGTGHGLHTGSTLIVPVHTMAEYRLLTQKRQEIEGIAAVRNRIVAPGPIPRSGGSSTGNWPSGHYSCSRLESLWISQGGNPSRAFMAAEIARAESGGNSNAISPTADYGLWQINRWAWGSLASLDPVSNARAAIRISANGSNWSPWTTYRIGAYRGQC